MHSEMDRGLLVAAFRWEIIAPLVTAGTTPEDKRQYRREVLKREHFDPVRGRRRVGTGCLKRWVKAYLKDGLDGLCPEHAATKASWRLSTAEVLDRAVGLRRESPRRTVKRLVELLRVELPDATISRYSRPSPACRGWSRGALRSAWDRASVRCRHRNAMWTRRRVARSQRLV